MCFIIYASISLGDTPPPGTVKAKMFTGDGSTGITATGTALDVNITNGGATSTVNQGLAGSQSWLTSITSSALPVNACQETGGHLASIDSKLTAPLSISGTVGIAGTVPVTGTFWQSTQPVSLISLPALSAGSATIGNVGVIGTVPVSGTFFQATQPISGNVGINGTVPVSLASTIGIGGTVAVSNFPATQPVSGTVGIGTTVSVTGTFFQATQPVSGTVGIGGTVATKAPINANATLSARQTVTGTETNLIAPSNAVGVILECESVNVDNLRWGFSNSTSTILSSTLGMLCEPGRDSAYIPMGIGTYLHMISTGAGSDFMDVQWVQAQ